jgi:acyl-CoA reductase-like NAD-dependent aldehyde dehydrogenase
LAASIFGRNRAVTLDVAQHIESGVCHISVATVKSESLLPLRGIKASGYGRFGGNASVHDLTELRTKTIHM